MEIEVNIDELRLKGSEAGEQLEAPEASPETRRSEELKRVEQALRDLAPHMEKFKDADKPALEAHAHEQIETLERELGEKLGAESVEMIHANLVTEVLARKESLQSTADGLNKEKNTLEGNKEQASDKWKQQFNYRIVQFQSEYANADIPGFFREFSKSHPTEEEFEAVVGKLNALRKEFRQDERIGDEKVMDYTERLRTIAAELNAGVRKAADVPEQQPIAADSPEAVSGESDPVDLTPEEQARRAEARTEQARAHVGAAMADIVAPEAATFDAKPIEISTSDDEAEEESAASSSDAIGADTGDGPPTAEDEAEAKENINYSAVEETIVNLVKSPETVLGEEHAEEKGPSPEKGVKLLLEALGSMYNDPDELVNRLKEMFGNYKIAWTHDRRVRPGLSEAAHKKMALEDITRDLSMKEAQAIEHLLQGEQTAEGEAKGLSKDVMVKNFIELIEEKSHIASPDTSSLDVAVSS